MAADQGGGGSGGGGVWRVRGWGRGSYCLDMGRTQ